jgi:hypothetical protein
MKAPTAPGATPEATIDVEAASFADLWLELKRRYVALRGSTPGPHSKAIPKTTNRDVLLLGTRWTVEATRARGEEARDQSERARWRASLAEVERMADASRPDAEYRANASFWDASNPLAFYLESLKMRPSRWQLARESIAESVHELPATLAAAGSAATAAARRFLGDPLKLAAVVLGAAIVIPAVLSRR